MQQVFTDWLLLHITLHSPVLKLSSDLLEVVLEAMERKQAEVSTWPLTVPEDAGKADATSLNVMPKQLKPSRDQCSVQPLVLYDAR